MESKTPNTPVRLNKFAKFFKGYMGVSAIVTAALPIPVTALKLLPVLGIHRTVLSVYTPLFCFFVLASIFYSRHTLARYMFPFLAKEHHHGRSFGLKCILLKLAPSLFIVVTLASIIAYHVKIDNVYTGYLKSKVDEGAIGEQVKVDEPLTVTWALEHYIPQPTDRAIIMGLYMSIFIFAAAAFILMALKEYIQDVIGISDREILGVEEKPHEAPEQAHS
jgi:hypothetical protein